MTTTDKIQYFLCPKCMYLYPYADSNMPAKLWLEKTMGVYIMTCDSCRKEQLDG